MGASICAQERGLPLGAVPSPGFAQYLVRRPVQLKLLGGKPYCLQMMEKRHPACSV
jgi:hypothetical protein